MNIGNNINVLQPVQEPLNLRAIQQNFYFSFNWGGDIDNATPPVAIAVAQEIQNTLSSGHPLRVYMFNFLSADAYTNPEFREIVRVIMGRIVLGVRNQEFPNLQTAMQTVIPAGVKFAASYLASQEAAMVDYLDNETISRVVPINAQMWLDMTGMVDGTTPYQPLSNFQQMNTNSAIGNLIGRGTQMGASDGFGATAGETSGAFSTAVRSSQGGTEGNTVNPGGRVNRFRRQLQEKQSAMAGALQTAMVDAAAKQEQGGNVPAWQRAAGSRLAGRGIPQQQPAQTTVAAQAVEAAVAEAEVNQPAPAPAPAPAEAPVQQPKQALFAMRGDDGKDHRVMEEILTGMNENVWKGNPAQRFHPAWCRRTHFIRYFRLENNWIVAVPTKYTEEQLAIAMNYDAHEIDPRLGKPAQNVPAKPPKEEAKVLYANKDQIRFVVKRLDNWSMQESVDTAIQSAVLDAECVASDADAVIKNAAVNTPLIYEDVLGAMKDLEVIEKISKSQTFKEAAELISTLGNPVARETINKWMTVRVNRMVACELGVPVSFTNFEEDGKNILVDLADDLGANIDALAGRQHSIISGVVTGVLAANENMSDYVENLFTGTPEERLALAERTIFLTRDVSVTWVKFNSTEMSVGIPNFGSGIVAETLYPALHGIMAASLKEKAPGAAAYFENILITRDNKRFRIHESLLGGSAMMISNYY